jgi:dephospho-CoA kinase
MLKVGITSGIGSGKTTVCQIFHLLGVPIFYADEAAKWLMNNDEKLIHSIKKLLGDEVYKNGQLARELVSSIVFNHPEKLKQLNALVHPASIQYASDWTAAQTTPYSIKEAAIFFESGSYKDVDIMIGVSAPEAIRIQRAMHRSGVTKEAVEARIAQQMNEEQKMSRCDYIIFNDDVQALIPQVVALHEVLLERSRSIVNSQ